VDAEPVMVLAKLAVACVQEDPALRPSVSNCEVTVYYFVIVSGLISCKLGAKYFVDGN
jgi:hypothetical protein